MFLQKLQNLQGGDKRLAFFIGFLVLIIVGCSNPLAVDTSNQNKEEIIVTTTTIFDIIPDTPRSMSISERNSKTNKMTQRWVETKTGKVTKIKNLEELKKMVIKSDEYLQYENGFTKEMILGFQSIEDLKIHVKKYKEEAVKRSVDYDYTWDKLIRATNDIGEGNLQISGRVMDAVLKKMGATNYGWWNYWVTIVEKNVRYVNYIYFYYDNGSFQPRTGSYPWGGNYTYYEWESKWESILLSRDMIAVGFWTDSNGRFEFKGLSEGQQVTLSVTDYSPFLKDNFSFCSTENRTETFTITSGFINKNRLDFQVSTNIVYGTMLKHIPETWDYNNKGVVMATILTKYIPGYPYESQVGGATVDLVPINGGSRNYRKYYFNPEGKLVGLIGYFIGPVPLSEKGFQETLERDGGVCFIDVDPGEYEIRAYKKYNGIDYIFTKSRVKVTARSVSNACYPNGVSVLFDPSKLNTHLYASNYNGGGSCSLTYYFRKSENQTINFNLYSNGKIPDSFSDSLKEKKPEDVYLITFSGGGGGDPSATHSLYLNNTVIKTWKGAYPSYVSSPYPNAIYYNP